MPSEPPAPTRLRPPPPFTRLLVTCEHAGNEVPAAYADLFADARAELDSHRGWDPGALGVALRLAVRRSAPLLATTTTRLLVEANRSPDNPGLFSARTRALPQAERARILDRFYHPHRRAVEQLVRDWADHAHRVLHVAVHSFTDVLDGQTRHLDVGLLFDPRRHAEADLCARWRAGLEAACGLRVRDNQPYLGTDDGLTTHLRSVFPEAAYAGVEVEIRQGLLALPENQVDIGDLLAEALPG